ncbi:MAG: signal recognition particle protein, partial [Treponema sp.]|nr:signal recognition particle protein [Treponema sp.]
RILGMGDIVSLVEKAQETVDEEQALKLQKKLSRNEFTLQDMLEQFQQVKKMGSLQSIMDMMPGMANMSGQMDTAGLKHQEAIIQSMTYKERLNHLIIGPSRRKRIAKGSGTSVAEVNKLIKQFEKTKLMMKKVTRNKGLQVKLMNQMGMNPNDLSGLSGMNPNGFDMSKLGDLSKMFKR